MNQRRVDGHGGGHSPRISEKASRCCFGWLSDASPTREEGVGPETVGGGWASDTFFVHFGGGTPGSAQGLLLKPGQTGKFPAGQTIAKGPTTCRVSWNHPVLEYQLGPSRTDQVAPVHADGHFVADVQAGEVV